MVIRVTIANTTPRQLARRVQGSGLSATVSASIGAGDWGVEEGATAEFAVLEGAGEQAVSDFIQGTLKALGEQAAYITVGSDKGTLATLLWQDGREERIG